MNCLVLIDAARPARWQRDCIERLAAEHAVAVSARPLAPARASDTFVRQLIGGKALRATAGSREIADANANAAPDLVLDLRAGAPADATQTTCARYWYLCDAEGAPLGALPGAREIAAGSPTFTLELRSRDANGSATLRAGTFKALYTYARSMEVALAECARWPALALALAADPPPSRAPRHATAPAQRAAIPLASLLLRQTAAFVAHIYTHLFVDARWSVGLIRGTPGDFLRPAYRPDIAWLRTPAREFLADPFVVRASDRRYVLGERIDRATQNGFIACLDVEEDGSVRGERLVMRSERHLSYPYAFEHAGAWYMVPESAQERRVVLYRAAAPPYEWEPVATLLEDVAACDNTIVRHGGRWWLFCTHADRDAHLNLFLYYADDLLGPWKPHAGNPVKTDIRSSRPAGTPFVADGALYRPAQDCARAYGDAIAFNRVTALDERAFTEETIARSQGAHTLSHDGGLMAIDAKQTIFASPAVIRRRLTRLAARIGRAAA